MIDLARSLQIQTHLVIHHVDTNEEQEYRDDADDDADCPPRNTVITLEMMM